MNEHDDITDELDPLDAELTALFAGVRPSATLEERAVAALKADVRRKRAFAGWQRALTVGLAASVSLGLAGAGIMLMPEMPFPGGEHATARTTQAKGQLEPSDSDYVFAPDEGQVRKLRTRRNDHQYSSTWRFGEEEKAKDLTNPDIGLDTDLKAVLRSTREAEVNVEDKVTPNAPVRAVDAPVAGSGGVEQKGKDSGGRTSSGEHFYGYYVPSSGTQWGMLPQGGPVTASAPAIAGTSIANGTAPPVAYTTTLGKLDGKAANELRELNQQLDTVAVPVAPKPVVSPQVKGTEAPAAPVRKVIRSGDIEFEVESFDSAFATVQLLVTKIPGGYVGTVNSDKMANGKVKGSIVVRVPPESLDPLVLELRKELGKAGELKGQRIGSQDITKQYTDLESRLKAARGMEERLLKVIAEGKGEIKALLEAERELGVWRTKIEEAQGELRYYDNHVSLSTLTINLTEREMRIATGLTESQRVQAGVEVEDVDAAYREVLKAVADAKGRVMKAELKQHAAGQFAATFQFEVAPEAEGPIRDRLKQLGRVARLEIDNVQTVDGGSPVPKDAKVKKGDTTFQVQLYNLANIAPRETATLSVAAVDVPKSYHDLQDAVAKAKGRVLVATLNEQDRQNVTAQFDFEIRRTEEPALRAALSAAGDAVSRAVTRAVETDAVTDTKLLYRVTLFNIARLKPRETTVLTVEVPDVENAASVATAQVAEAKGKQLDSQSQRQPSGQVTAKLTYAVPLAAVGSVVEKLKSAGTVRVADTSRDPSAIDGPAATARIVLTLTSVDPIVAPDDGLWHQVRKGLSFSATALLKSVTWVFFGLCVVLPWAFVGYGVWRLLRRRASRGA